MIPSTSDNSDPARINFRMLRTASLEKKPGSLCAPSSFGRSSVRDCVADFISSTSGLECRLGQSETATAPGGKHATNSRDVPAEVGFASRAIFLLNPGDRQTIPG